MKCLNPDCKKTFDHQEAARLQTTDKYIEVVLFCPHCEAQHYTSIRPDELILAP
jgi:hypothetical protein